MFSKHRILYKLSMHLLLFTILFGSLFIRSCDEQAYGFALPEGDVEAGKITYKMLSCNECHTISGIEWQGGSDSINITLGGDVVAKKSYGDLVTSVINPSHKIAQGYEQQTTTEEGLSKMENYNEVMTVQELIDLVTFLQSEYKIKAPTTKYYPYY